MANISSLLSTVCSCFAFAGFVFGEEQADSHPLFRFPPLKNFNLQGIASSEPVEFLPAMNNESYVQLSTGDETRATFSRMTYKQPIYLWDDNSSFLANFTSHFKFQVLTSDDESHQYGDGLAFFLAPFDSEPPLNCTGQWLGLFNHATDGNPSNQIVAVEFDTFQNDPFDPDDNHIGIDVNGIVSKANVSVLSNWGIDIRGESTVKAWVEYDGIAKRLHVFLTTSQQKPETPVLSYDIDLTRFLPQKIMVGISASTSAHSADQHNVYYWDFNSHHLPIPTKNNRVLVSVVASLSTVAGLALLAGLYYWRYKRCHVKEEDVEMDKLFTHEGPRKFSHAELSAATHNFSHEQKLGGGGFGDVYRGVLPGSKEAVVVKRISQRSKQGKKEYISEVTIISKLRHRNLVQLLGWSHCHQKGELLLVYEFLSNGSLDKYIFSGTCLDWSRRYVIVCDIAAALVYLHEECKERVVHRDVKSSNIMLDSDYRAKIGDFGLARLSAGNFGNGASTVIAGMVGYIAPECVVSRKPSIEWDVFSFGAVCLEIACGRRVVDSHFEEHGSRLVEWVWDLHSKGKLLTAADERLNVDFSANEMERVLMLGLLCSHPHPKARPNMRKVVNILRLEAEVPQVPLTYPITLYGGTVGPFELPLFPMHGKIPIP